MFPEKKRLPWPACSTLSLRRALIMPQSILPKLKTRANNLHNVRDIHPS